MPLKEVQQLFFDYAISFDRAVIALKAVTANGNTSERKKLMENFKREQKITEKILKKIRKKYCN